MKMEYILTCFRLKKNLLAAITKFRFIFILQVAVILTFSHITPALSDYRSGFDELNASTTGVSLTGQGGYTTPLIPGVTSIDYNVFYYHGNAYGLPQNRTGGSQFIAGLHQGGDLIARGSHDLSFEFGGVWEVAYDFAVTLDGTPNLANNFIGSLETQPQNTSASIGNSITWVDAGSPTKIRSYWKVYNTNGDPVAAPGATPTGIAWSDLNINHWYRLTTTIDYDIKRIVEVKLQDLDGTSSITFRPTDWYIRGGSSSSLSLPDSFRLTAGDSVNSAGNILALDNIHIRNISHLEKRGTLTAYDRGRHLTWLIDANAPQSMGVIHVDPLTGATTPTPRYGLLNKNEADLFVSYFNSQFINRGGHWRMPGNNNGCYDSHELNDLYRAMGNIIQNPIPGTTYNTSVEVSEDFYVPPGVTVSDTQWDSPTTFRTDIDFVALQSLQDDPKVVETDVGVEPYLDNRYPFNALSSSSPYWLENEVSASTSRAFWFFNGNTIVSNPNLRRYVILVHDGDVYQTTGEQRPVDTDGDMISDDIDTDAANSSNDFSDLGTGGTSSGSVLERGGQLLSIAPMSFGGIPVIRIRSGAHHINNEFATFPEGLQRRGNFVIYDADQDLTWQRDTNMASTIGYPTMANTTYSDGSLTFEEAAGCGEELGYDTCVTPPASPVSAEHFLDYINTASIPCGNSWRLPRPDAFCPEGTGCEHHELGHLYYNLLANPWGTGLGPVLSNRGPFSNIQITNYYWAGQDLYSDLSEERFIFHFGHGNHTTLPKNSGAYVWPVHPGDVAGPAPARVSACADSMEISMYRWQSANIYCDSAHVKSIRGRIKVKFKTGSVEINTWLPPGHGLGFDPDQKIISSPADNTRAVSVFVEGVRQLVQPGGTIQIDSDIPPWQIIILLLIVALLIFLIWYFVFH